jgi:hypothetical protein
MESASEKTFDLSTSRPKKSIGFLIGIFALLLILVYVMSVNFSDKDKKEDVSVSDVNLLTAEGAERLPVGFPSDIPVEVGGAYESYAMDYEDRGVKQYTVSFVASESFEAAYRLYADYLSQNGFISERDLVFRNQNPETLYGTRDNDDISIVITQNDERVDVQISYLDR